MKRLRRRSTAQGEGRASVQHRFCVISSCPVNWAGSEELWAGAAKSLLEGGHRIHVLKTKVDYSHTRIQHLQSLGCEVRDLLRVRLSVLKRLFNLVAPERFQLHSKHLQSLYIALYLMRYRPALVLISQGDNREGLHFAHLCRRLRLPYVLVTQKVVDFDWPQDHWRSSMRRAFTSAQKSFFVSRHNQRLTEEHIGARLSNAQVVWNPYVVSDEGVLSWPNREDGKFHLACVARLFLKDKGQDMLLQVLSLEKWKTRNLHVSFFGEGSNREGLLWLAEQKGVTNASFCGSVADVAGIWRTHHALILPSRSEGLPLSLVEAMMCGRMAIVTNVGGNTEVVEDGFTGFVSEPSIGDLDATLERAWQQREEWQRMGELAARKIREKVPADPAATFADQLVSLVSSFGQSVS